MDPTKPTLLQQALAESERQQAALPKGARMAFIAKGTTEDGGGVRVGIIGRTKGGSWTVISDLGISKEEGVEVSGTVIRVIK